jgi:hypothetical protein
MSGAPMRDVPTADPFAALDPLGRARRAFLGRASLGLGALALQGLGGCAASPAAFAGKYMASREPATRSVLNARYSIRKSTAASSV